MPPTPAKHQKVTVLNPPRSPGPQNAHLSPAIPYHSIHVGEPPPPNLSLSFNFLWPVALPFALPAAFPLALRFVLSVGGGGDGVFLFALSTAPKARFLGRFSVPGRTSGLVREPASAGSSCAAFRCEGCLVSLIRLGAGLSRMREENLMTIMP